MLLPAANCAATLMRVQRPCLIQYDRARVPHFDMLGDCAGRAVHFVADVPVPEDHDWWGSLPPGAIA